MTFICFGFEICLFNHAAYKSSPLELSEFQRGGIVGHSDVNIVGIKPQKTLGSCVLQLVELLYNSSEIGRSTRHLKPIDQNTLQEPSLCQDICEG